MSREVVEPWASAMVKAGLVDRRNGRPSMRRLADEAKTTPSTISAMMYGDRDTNGDVIRRVAKALRMEDRADEVGRWVGHAQTQPRPFVAHRDADLLTAEEQEAVNELIRLLALPKKRGGAEDVSRDPAANEVPELEPADQTSNAADLIVRRYLKQADNAPAVAARLLAHDGAKGANADADTWNAALKILADMTPDEEVDELPADAAARRSKKRPPRGPKGQSAD